MRSKKRITKCNGETLIKGRQPVKNFKMNPVNVAKKYVYYKNVLQLKKILIIYYFIVFIKFERFDLGN